MLGVASQQGPAMSSSPKPSALCTGFKDGAHCFLVPGYVTPLFALPGEKQKELADVQEACSIEAAAAWQNCLNTFDLDDENAISSRLPALFCKYLHALSLQDMIIPAGNRQVDSIHPADIVFTCEANPAVLLGILEVKLRPLSDNKGWFPEAQCAEYGALWDTSRKMSSNTDTVCAGWYVAVCMSKSREISVGVLLRLPKRICYRTHAYFEIVEPRKLNSWHDHGCGLMERIFQWMHKACTSSPTRAPSNADVEARSSNGIQLKIRIKSGEHLDQVSSLMLTDIHGRVLCCKDETDCKFAVKILRKHENAEQNVQLGRLYDEANQLHWAFGESTDGSVKASRG